MIVKIRVRGFDVVVRRKVRRRVRLRIRRRGSRRVRRRIRRVKCQNYSHPIH